jgi:hypothetical protein
VRCWQGWSRARIVNAVDSLVLTTDPDAARQRRQRADDERCIGITALPNGMADLWGTVNAAHATAFDQRLSALATAVRADDPRTMDQRRADALTALTQGRSLGCQCGKPDCPHTSTAENTRGTGGTRVVVNVVATDQTVSGRSERPGYVDGYGVIDADQVRELAAGAAKYLLDNPAPTGSDPYLYRPSAALERFIRCRDLTCRFPGCDRPARVCDIDHTIPYNHSDPAAGGLTVAGNLACYCRQSSLETSRGTSRTATVSHHVRSRGAGRFRRHILADCRPDGCGRVP